VSGLEILVLGGGGREHALAWRLSRDERVARVRIAPGDGGTPAVAETVADLDPLDPSAVARHASRQRYDVVVVGPEAPLAAGVSDALDQAGINVFGPTREAARLESSKAYAKRQMRRAGVPTAQARAFTDLDAAIAHATAEDAAGRRLVVKADGLAGGKGVAVPDSLDATHEAIRSLMAGPDGGQILLEERLTGREVSAFALVSGPMVVPLAAACDYKRLWDGDLGPNTGGMGAYAPVPWFGAEALGAVTASVFEPVAWLMARDAVGYRGVLYAGLILTEDQGPMVLEFNARFGDPEAQVVLPMLEGDLAAALLGVATGDRGAMEGSLGTRRGTAVGVVVASEGYPDAPVTARSLDGAEPSSSADDGELLVFHAATQRTPSGYETSGGRVVTFVGRGSDLVAAREAAYRGVAACELAGGQYRSDIAERELADQSESV